LCENVVVEHRRFAIGAMGVRSGPPLAVGRKRHSERRRKTRSVPTNDNPCKPALSNMSIRCSERSSLRSLALGQTEQSARLRCAVMPSSLDGGTLAALVSPNGDLDGALHAGGGRAPAAVIMAADVKLQ